MSTFLNICFSSLTGAFHPAAPALYHPATWVGGPQWLSGGDSCCALRGGCIQTVAFHFSHAFLFLSVVAYARFIREPCRPAGYLKTPRGQEWNYVYSDLFLLLVYFPAVAYGCTSLSNVSAAQGFSHILFPSIVHNHISQEQCAQVLVC